MHWMTCQIPSPSALLLAQAAKAYSPTPVFIWVGVLITFAVVGGTLMVILRKKLFERQSAAEVRGSLMEQLRDAHARGEISTEEYEQARKSMASRLSHVMDTKRGAGLFELPDPKRPTKRPASKFGAPNLFPGEVPQSPTSPETGELRAPPGYDLTGRPLPPPANPE